MEGPGWKPGDKSGGHSRGQTHDGYGCESNHEGGKRWLDSRCLVDLGGEGEGIKDASLSTGGMYGAV